MKKNDESAKIAYFISDFLNTYAPTFLTNSRHTLKSYKDSLVLYLSFLEAEDIEPDCFGRKCFESPAESIADGIPVPYCLVYGFYDYAVFLCYFRNQHKRNLFCTISGCLGYYG